MNKRIKKKLEKNQIKNQSAFNKETINAVSAEPAEVEEVNDFVKYVEPVAKKHHKRTQNCILFALLAMSIVGITIYGFIVSWYGDYLFEVSLDRPVFMSIFTGEMDEPELLIAEATEEESDVETVPAEIETISEEAAESEEESTEEEESVKISANLLQEFMEYYHEIPYTIGDDELTHYVGWNDNKSGSRYYTNPGVRAVSTIYDYKQVDQSYFDNALIIGDSRIEGLHAYSGWDNATFLYKRGLTVYAMMDKEINLNSSGRSTAMQVLSERQFDNIYIMVGINELGGGTDEAFAEKYQENINQIKELQPDARIIIMSIMFETKEYSDSKPVYNNDNVNAKNVAIAKLANGEDVFYLDVNPCIADPETGVMPGEYSFDGVHMKAQYYSYWVDYMYAHGY